MFADMEHALEKMDQAFQPIREDLKENKKRGYTVVRVQYSVVVKEHVRGSYVLSLAVHSCLFHLEMKSIHPLQDRMCFLVSNWEKYNYRCHNWFNENHHDIAKINYGRKCRQR